MGAAIALKETRGDRMNNSKILVVDDETYIVELVKFNLEKEGYQGSGSL